MYVSIVSKHIHTYTHTHKHISLYVYISLRRYSSNLSSVAWRTRYQDTAAYNSLDFVFYTIT